MIETVIIENFQSLKKAHLLFGTFNCIIGPSDSGKSAFIRALRACITARRGFDFVTFGCDRVTVKVGFSDRSAIIWRRTKTTGRYQIHRDGRIQEFTKYGHSCPQEVADVAKLGSFVIDEQVSFNPNFSAQFDPLFLISERGSTIAKILSTVTNANNLLLAVREANLTAGKKATELKVYEEQIIEFDEQIRGFGWLGEVGEQIALVQQNLDKATEKRQLIDGLVVCSNKLKAGHVAISDYTLEIASIHNVLELCDRALVCEEKAKTLAMLKRLYGRALLCVKQYGLAIARLNIAEKQLDAVSACDEKHKELVELQMLQRLERCAVENHRLYQDALCGCRRIGCEIGQIIDQMAEFSSCPLCGNPLGEKSGSV